MKKKLLRALLTAALGMCALACTARADCVGGAVTSTDVNLRSGAGTDTAILDTLPSGTAVIVISDNGSGWYEVHYNGLNGYMSADYLDFSSELGVSASGAVSGTDVNLRSGPGTDSAIVRVTSEGEEVSVTGVNGNWYQVSVGGDTGYIRSDYVAHEIRLRKQLRRAGLLRQRHRRADCGLRKAVPRHAVCLGRREPRGGL